MRRAKKIFLTFLSYKMLKHIIQCLQLKQCHSGNKINGSIKQNRKSRNKPKYGGLAVCERARARARPHAHACVSYLPSQHFSQYGNWKGADLYSSRQQRYQDVAEFFWMGFWHRIQKDWYKGSGTSKLFTEMIVISIIQEKRVSAGGSVTENILPSLFL